VLIPAAVLGIVTGGVIMNKLNLSIIGMTKYLIFMNFIPIIALSTLFALGCDGVDIAGITTSYYQP
jgi:hypothetical protein